MQEPPHRSDLLALGIFRQRPRLLPVRTDLEPTGFHVFQHALQVGNVQVFRGLSISNVMQNVPIGAVVQPFTLDRMVFAQSQGIDQAVGIDPFPNSWPSSDPLT